MPILSLFIFINNFSNTKYNHLNISMQKPPHSFDKPWRDGYLCVTLMYEKRNYNFMNRLLANWLGD